MNSIRFTPNTSKINYNLRFVTKSGISHPNANVQLLIMNKQKEAVLSNICRVDTNNNSRFETSSQNFIELYENNIGEIDEVWVYPECGVWKLDSLYISNDHSNIVHEFKCDYDIGTDKHPVGILSQQQKQFDVAIYENNMTKYNEYKQQILMGQLILLSVVTSTVSFRYGIDIGMEVVKGGVSGFLYLILLQKNVDQIGKIQFMYNGFTRLIAITYLFLSANLDQHSFIPFMLGFFLYKPSVILMSLKSND